MSKLAGLMFSNFKRCHRLTESYDVCGMAAKRLLQWIRLYSNSHIKWNSYLILYRWCSPFASTCRVLCCAAPTYKSVIKVGTPLQIKFSFQDIVLILYFFSLFPYISLYYLSSADQACLERLYIDCSIFSPFFCYVEQSLMKIERFLVIIPSNFPFCP